MKTLLFFLLAAPAFGIQSSVVANKPCWPNVCPTPTPLSIAKKKAVAPKVRKAIESAKPSSAKPAVKQ